MKHFWLVKTVTRFAMKYKLTNFSESRVGGALLRHFSNKGTEFEIKVERTLRALSCDLIQTPASQDGGIDHNVRVCHIRSVIVLCGSYVVQLGNLAIS